MDARTRHSLKQNELAEALTKLRTLSDPRIRIALIAIAVIAVLYVGYRWWSSSRAASVASSWQTVLQFDPSAAVSAMPPLDALQEIVRSDSDSALASAARLKIASALVVRARQPGAESEKLLREALDAIKPVTTQAGANATFAASALYLQAWLHESLREFDAAGVCYRTLMDDSRFESSPYRTLAMTQSANLTDLAKRIEFTPGSRPQPAATTPPTVSPGPSTLTDVLPRMVPEPIVPAPVAAPAPTPAPAPAPVTPPPAADTPPPSTQPAATPASTP